MKSFVTGRRLVSSGVIGGRVWMCGKRPRWFHPVRLENVKNPWKAKIKLLHVGFVTSPSFSVDSHYFETSWNFPTQWLGELQLNHRLFPSWAENLISHLWNLIKLQQAAFLLGRVVFISCFYRPRCAALFSNAGLLTERHLSFSFLIALSEKHPDVRVKKKVPAVQCAHFKKVLQVILCPELCL